MKWSFLKQLIGTYEQRKDIFISLINKEGEIICANANMVKSLHLPNPRQLATNFFDFLHPVSLTGFKAAIRDAKKKTGPFTLELTLKNGYYYPMKWEINYMQDDKSNSYLCIGHRITDDTMGNELSGQLQEREVFFNVFMKQTPNLAWVVDEDANLIFASQSFYQYFGLDEKKAINRNIVELVPAGVATSLYQKHRQVLQTGIPAELLEKVKWADGTNFIFQVKIFPIEGISNKKLLGGYAVNFADKLETEKQLQEANDRLLLLTRTTSDAIWEWDMQTGQIFRNDALMDMIGYHLEKPKGLSWWLRRIHPEDRNRISDKVKETTDKNLQSWEDEYRFKCADGNYKHMHDKGYVVYESELPVKMIGSLQDITGLKELETQLMEEKLQRQKEISETVIRVQEKERNRIGIELHDNVNQILSSTKLYVDMLTPASNEEKAIKQKSLEYITMAVEEIRKLSKELVEPQLKQNGLVASIETLIEDVHRTTDIKMKFTHNQENDLLSAGKKVTIFRIVQEQLKNILKHSKANNVDINLQSTTSTVNLIIKDNGMGFDLRQTHRGIGLSNIYERTRFYNGSADIQTASGKGCCLNISIPVL